MAEREYPYSQKITTVGGGAGQVTTLRGLVKYNAPGTITAIPGTWDSGGSTGEIRIKEGTLPAGDYVRCLLGLMRDEEQFKEAMLLLNDRSDGHPTRNIIANKAEKTHHGVIEGITALRKLFLISDWVVPVSTVDAHLNGDTKSGKNINGEHKIDGLKNDPNFHLNDSMFRIYFTYQIDANPKALEAIQTADKVILVAGSPRTSIFPHLLVRGIPEAILESSAKMVAVLNLMTTGGEDHDLGTATEWLKVFQYYLGDKEWINKKGRSRLEYLIVNEKPIEKEIVDFYEKSGQKLVNVGEAEIEECEKMAPGLTVVRGQLAHYDPYSHLLRHDPDVLAKTILEL